VESSLRINYLDDVNIVNGDRTTQTESMILAEASIFDIFDFKLISGDVTSCLNKPEAVLLSPKHAKALFGDEDPLGKAITIRGIDNAHVTGIIEPSPDNSHIRYDAIVAMVKTEEYARFFESWGGLQTTGYLLLAEDANPEVVIEKATALALENNTPDVWKPQLQPLLDIHLKSSHIIYDHNYAEGDLKQVRALSVIALIVLLIASINFMNLSTARSAKRAREVGLRKVIGAHRIQMVLQFLGESVLLTVIATALSVLFTKLALPYLNQLSGKSLELNVLSSSYVLPMIIGTAFIVGILSGLYPATVLSNFKPALVLKGSFKSSKSGILMRRMLVVSQFAITIALLVGTLVIISQINFILSRDPGYNREQVMVLEHRSRDLEGRGVLVNKIAQLPSVLFYGTSSNLPVRAHGRRGITPEGAGDDEHWIMSANRIDEGFINTYQMKIVEGRAFSPEFPSDSSHAIMVNEAVVRQMEWDDAIGKKLRIGGPDEPYRAVIGVIKDYNFASVREVIEPMVYVPAIHPSYLLSLRIDAGQTQNAIKDIEKIWYELYPEDPFVFSFVDDEFEATYNSDKNFATVVTTFSTLAIIIACLGLFGLASYSTEQRLKEIAVRKVLGAEETKIIKMLTIDFVRWVMIANLIAWPIGYYAMQKWLSGFVFKINLTLWPFLLAGMIALTIAILTVVFQSIKASRTNPALALRVDM